MNLEYAVICQFRFVCSQKWTNLVPIYGEIGRRHCTVCDKSVHLTTTYEELASHAAARRCVAIFAEEPQGQQLEIMGDVSSEVDPAAEADVYLAYGRDIQAEEILKVALGTLPGRHDVRLKLMKIYFKRKDLRSFEVLADELFSMTRGECEEWGQVASMGLTLDSINPLYASK